MNERLKRIEEELAEELTRVETAIGELDGRRTTLLAERDRLAATLAELRGKPASPKPPAKNGANRQPCATKAEVQELVTRVLQQNGPCAEEDLIDLVEDALKQAGRSRSGFKLRYEGVRREFLTTTRDGRLALADAPTFNPPKGTL